jgi:hypothetical protein
MCLIVLSKTHARAVVISLLGKLRHTRHALCICQTLMSSQVCPKSAGERRTDPSFTMSIASPIPRIPRSRFCKLVHLDREEWWSQTGSNRRPHACKARALPTELWPHRSRLRRAWSPSVAVSGSRSKGVVGPGRLELPTSRLSGVRSNQAELRAYGSETPGNRSKSVSPLGSRSRRLTCSVGGEWKEKRRRRYPAYL